MKISTLVSYLTHLKKFDPGQARTALNQHIAPVVHSVASHDVQFYELTDQLISDMAKINDDVDTFAKTLYSLKESLERLIVENESEYFTISYELYDEALRYDSPEWIINRTIVLEKEQEEFVISRLLANSDWHYPGLIIRPGLETWIDHLVSLDPLYLLDESWVLLDPIKEKFSEDYIQRLRFYTINEFRDADKLYLHSVPDNQIGFALIYNYFHNKPYEIIKQYLAETFQKLRPGGTVAFTFNDCDRFGGVEMVERKCASYTPGRMIYAYLEELGFKITQRQEIATAATWVEATKPGTLTSIRGGQALAKIVAVA